MEVLASDAGGGLVATVATLSAVVATVEDDDCGM
jgi:hypothetical protein